MFRDGGDPGDSVLLWHERNDLIGTSVPVDGLRQEPASQDESEPAGLRKAKTVLLVGDHSGDVSRENRDIATGERGSHLTDTIMVLRIDPEAGRVTGINFPRDLFVTLCDGSRQKINAAFTVGGADCLVKTIRDFGGIRIDHFVSVDFQGFVDIVDEVGGVTMYLEAPMTDPKAHLDLDKGCVTLDGRDALGFVRTRRNDDDFGRIARQQRFFKELADEATSLDVVANPVRLFRTVDAVSGMLTIDDGMTLGTMRDFAMTMRGVESDAISMATIPTAPDHSTDAWLEIPVQPTTNQLLRAFERGQLARFLGEEPREKPAKQRRKPQIALDELGPVDVRNASDVDQLAAKTAAVLRAAGVRVSGAGNIEGPEPATVVIRYPQRLDDQAAALRTAALPDAALDADSSVDHVTVVLNAEFDPDLIDIADSSDEEVTSTDRLPPQRDFANAELVENRDC